MLAQIKKSWVTKTLSQEELIAYSGFQDDLKVRFGHEHHSALEQGWQDLVREIAANLQEDPSGAVGQALAKRCIELTNQVCGPEHARLRAALWQKGFTRYPASASSQTSPKILSWIDKAMDAYWKMRIQSLMTEVEHLSPKEVEHRWEQILQDMCGDDQGERNDILKAALKDNQVNTVAKDWLQKNYGLKA